MTDGTAANNTAKMTVSRLVKQAYFKGRGNKAEPPFTRVRVYGTLAAGGYAELLTTLWFWLGKATLAPPHAGSRTSPNSARRRRPGQGGSRLPCLWSPSRGRACRSASEHCAYCPAAGTLRRPRRLCRQNRLKNGK